MNSYLQFDAISHKYDVCSLGNSTTSSGAVQRLSEKGLLDADAIVRTDEATMASLIYPVYP